MNRSGVGANLFVLADVVGLRLGRGHQRPYVRDVRLLHVKEAGSDRGHKPLVQRGAVKLAAELSLHKRELGEGVCPVDNDRDAVLPTELADVMNRVDLAVVEADVREEDQLGLPSDALLDGVK